MAFVVFCTTYSLILPAITLDRQTAESEPGIEAETTAEETLGEVQDANLLLAGQNEEVGETEAAEPETEEVASITETEEAESEEELETEEAESEEELETETEEVYAKSPLIYHCDQYDIELSFDSEEWQLPEDTVLSVKELHKDAEVDSEEYLDYHYYDDRAKEELADQDEELAERADALHFYELQLKAEGEELSMPEGEADVTIKYNSKDNTSYNAKEFGDEETVLASLFWLTDWHTYLFDENVDESKVYTVIDKHLKEIKIKDVELSDFDNVIGLYACPPEKKVTLKAEGSDYSVTAVCGQKSGVPEEAKLTVSEIKSGSKEFEQYLDSAREALGEEKEDDVPAVQARFFDIKIMVDGEEFTPEAEIDVKIDFHEPVVVEQMQDVSAVHFGEDGTEVLDVTTEESKEGIENVSFTADSFSVYGVVYTVEFSWEVDGEKLTYTLKGGDALSFAKLAEKFGLAESYIRSYDGKFKKADSESPVSSVEGDNNTETNDVSRRFIEQVKTVKFSNPDLVWVEKATEDTATWKIMIKHNLHPEYPYGTTEQEFCEMYNRTFKAPDWVLLSLKAFDTTETLTVTMKTGEVIKIEVTDAQDAPMIDDGQGGQVVQTINNPNGTTIDLFDYWITSDTRNKQGMDGWPGHQGDAFSSWNFDWYNYYGQRQYPQNNPMTQDPDRNNDWYINNNYLRGNGNNQGINSGHVFKFYPGAAGTVEDYGDKGWHTHGTGNAWTNNHDQYSSINSWTGSADPTTGLVQPYLNGQGYPQLTNDASKGTDGSALNYLFDDNSHAGKQKYEGVNNLLYVNPDGYYTYDSWFYSADLNDDNTNFTVKEHSSGAAQAQRGFWPFGDRVNWHGMHMTTEFSMPANGQVLNPKGEYKDMEFEFHGDDDTWLYVDGILVGDGGGIHNHTKININFKTGKVIVTGTDDPVADHVGTYTSERYLDEIFQSALAAQGKSQAEINAYIAENFDGHTFKAGSKHTFEMFYLERGGSESNLYIRYNLVSTTDFTAHKSYHMLQGDPHARLERDQFKFELIGFDNTDLGTGFQQAIMPANGTPTGDGTYASPKKIYHEATADSEGYTSLITGVTEDGNVNFGNIQVQASQAGMTYRYMVREVVDPDAENADGIAWKDATEEQRAEGGFIDENGVTYDGRVYYFTGTVQETSPGSGKYELKKTRYTDETYSTIDTETKFFSFVNGHVEPITLKVLKKSDSDNHKPLSGAQFSLSRGKHVVEVDDLGNVTSERWIPRPESTLRTGATSNGTLTFDNLTEGHYILEETAAPSGYTRNGTYRWLLTMTKEDSADEIKLIPTIRPLDAAGNATGPAETLTVDENHTIEHEILNAKLPRGPLTVEKKWLKPDGTTEYTPEELAELDSSVQNTQITGELWRRYAADAADPPTVSIYAKLNNESDYQLRWQKQVEPGSSVVFSMAVNGTGYPINQKYTTDTGDTVSPAGDQNITYDNGINKPSGHKFSLSNIEHDVKIYGEFNSSQAGNQNPKIGFYMVSYTAPTGTGQQQTIEQQVGNFTLDKNNNWKVTWTSEDLNEDDYDYEYYLKNVSEPALEGFTFIKDAEITTDIPTGSMTYAVKNIKEGPMTDLTVRKVWGDNNDHSDQTISYKIQRTEYNAEGAAASAAVDYIETGKTAAEVYTLSASDLYDGVAWQKHHDRLPATNGKEETDPDYRSYKYSVVEVNVPSEYTASYLTITEPNDGDPYEVAVIKNSPTDARVSVEKKWMNNGQTSEITTGIPEGAYITGTLKKTYTWQEATGTTVRVYNRLWANGQILSTTLYQTYNDVGAGTDFNLWAIDSSGNEPLNGVQANGSPAAQSGPSRTYNMGGWNKSTNAYVIRINGETQIILDWAYNTGFQNGWHYDVDYTRASGGGQSHTETETVGTFRIDASNDWSWVWTDRELDQDHVYTYFFENVQEHSADGTVVANFDGFKAPEVGNLTQGADGRWTCSIINEQENLKTEIILKKVDSADLHKENLTADDLLEGAKFKLEKYTALQPDQKDEEWNTANSVETTGDGSGTFTFTDLPVGYYKIVETKYPDGYARMQSEPIIWIRKVEGESRLEVVQVDQSGEPLDDTTDEIIRIMPNQTADPTTIVVGNTPGAALPSTGGPGTLLFTILGSILILGAGALLWRRRRII